MAKCTKEQLNKWNDKLMNGFSFDLYGFLMNGEKTAVKTLALADGKKLQAKLEYRDVRENFRTVAQQPVLHLSIWEDCENSSFMKSCGLGAYLDMGVQQAKKNYDLLCKLSGTLSDDDLLAKANEHMGRLTNPFVFG